MTLPPPHVFLLMVLAFIAGVGIVTSLGYCLSCKNSEAIDELYRLDAMSRELHIETAKRVAELESKNAMP